MALVIENVSKRFQSKNKEINVLEKINLEVQKGKFICILGPSGCGKSTLLNIIAGLEKPSEGKVFLNGREVLSPGPDRVVMFQESALFPWLKVIDNVEFGMKIRGVPKKERHERALKYLKMVHLTKFKDVYVHQLSGGMKQRVALARALTLDSEILLMDEPFAALDSQTKNILLLELQRIWWETKKTIIFVTHNIEEAVLLADKVVVMSSNPGKIKKVFEIKLARPRLLDNPDIVYMISAIMKELKDEVEKIAKAEYDSDWSFEKDTVLYSSDSSLGIGL
ncbi:NitT/TauT family transport system ATP-binding protein [Caldicellulosiruptor bescii]|uniref:ABC-type quaternary amine transporter n=2 Tax=Caldicellulosiruptor bescii TaxID=31899 RepID=B9MRH9_CALBD|nr:ABC transporter ATP-binding protein [Caldicellulosiruptor bescii]ACM60283.1 ABC transporter related [Caldicellulosiruptor bescii DSM 6725]PBC87698.1 NitT/TauT family transport system ATP-binding protein [Caldicellulosiruptor bescii]PBC90631.1 NitT/TauT family transport system ATP-binding protein [Caldicellulosiruptor bescii]PBD03937.1 NitT/TauT family transport system ATP-binding protein [Caldicellulosiruptor bescii]PBD06428.1 NitT/TauT family transport system ATP-binding protein [Caldicell